MYLKKQCPLQITAAATNLTPKSGISHCGKKGCITYFAKVNPIIELVVGLETNPIIVRKSKTIV